MRIPRSRPSITQDDLKVDVSVHRAPVLNLGPRACAWERVMAAHTGVAEGVAVNCGTRALHLARAADGIGPGDEVVTNPFSFVASANCVLDQGTTPIFAAIDPLTVKIDPGSSSCW